MTRRWMSAVLWLPLILSAPAVASHERGNMEPLELMLEGRTVVLTPAARHEGAAVWVPLAEFCRVAGIELKDVGGSLAVCDDGGDVCVLLTAEDTRDVAGTPFGRLDAFATPLNLAWTARDGVLEVARGVLATTGLGVGDRPPEIHLPDMETGKLVSSPTYIGKPAVFYMWASW